MIIVSILKITWSSFSDIADVILLNHAARVSERAQATGRASGR